MEHFKKDIFYKEFGKPFPDIESLSIDRRVDIIEAIKKEYDINRDENIFIRISQTCEYIDSEVDNANEIKHIFLELDMSFSGSVLVIWDVDNIDEISTCVLLEYWEYIWYGVSDDAIILIQPETNKLLQIVHWGRTYYSNIKT